MTRLLGFILCCFIVIQTAHSKSTVRAAILSQTMDSDARAWASLVVSNSGTVNQATVKIVSDFCKSAKRNGYWNNLLDVGPLAGDQLAAALVKLKTSPVSTGSIIGNTGFVSGDYTPTGGFAGASGKLLDPKLNFNTFTTGLGGMSVYVASQPTTNGFRYLGGVALSGGSPYLQILGTGTLGSGTGFDVRWGDAGPFTFAASTSRGFYQVIRQSLSSLSFFGNGKLLNSSSTTATAATRSAAIQIMSATATFYLPQSVGFYAFDDGGMSSTQCSSFAADVLQLQSDLGRLGILNRNANYSLIVGQSLADGSTSVAISTTQPYSNLTFSGGVRNPSAASQYSFTPLVEGGKETIASGWANEVGELTRAVTPGSIVNDLTVGEFGVTGAAYSTLKKGTTPYNNSITSVTNARAVSLYFTTSFSVPGIAAVHGETDNQSSTYKADIEEWQSDYESDIKAITGQIGTVPMFHSQISSWAASPGTATSPYAVLAAYEANPIKTVLVCPKYFLAYFDNLHLTATSYKLLGEYYAKAWYSLVCQGVTYSPLRPSSVSRSGAVITVSFAGAVGALVLDTTAITDPGNYGFEWTQTGGTARTISSVALINSNTQVQITLTGDPGAASNMRVRYAYTSTGNAGPTTGPRGCLRDSDSTVGRSGTTLSNWCVHFDKLCP